VPPGQRPHERGETQLHHAEQRVVRRPPRPTCAGTAGWSCCLRHATARAMFEPVRETVPFSSVTHRYCG
jgi:hypothetical protein